MDWGIVPNTGGTVNGTVLTTVIVTLDIPTSGAKGLVVMFRLRGTVTPADMGAPAVRPYQLDGVTVHNIALTGFQPPVAAATSPDVWALGAYDLRGIQKVRAQFSNQNAGTLNYDLLYYLL